MQLDNYYHQLETLGRYDLSNKQIMLDFKRTAGDEVDAKFTLIHESIHAVLAVETDFGQVTHILYRLQKSLLIDAEETKKMLEAIYKSQKFVQEGLATIIPFSILKNEIGKERADEWAEKNITNTDNVLYKTYFRQLYFVSDLSPKHREKFEGLISSLVMETGFRKLAPQMDLLKSAKNLDEYLSKNENNPDKRFEKAIDFIKNDLSILDLSIPEMAKKMNIPYIPSNKEEIAQFMTYLASKTKHPFEYKKEDVSDRPDGNTTLHDTLEKMVVGDINLDFERTGEIIFDYSDFLKQANDIKVVFAHQINPNIGDLEILKFKSKENPEVGIVGFLPNGRKYITFVNKNTAIRILNNELKHKTMVVRYENYDIKTLNVLWLKGLREPELILYSYPKQMKEFMEATVNIHPEIKIRHLHSQFMENNPLQSLFVSIKSYHPIHTVSHYGNRGISEVLSVIKAHSTIMDRPYIEYNRMTINNLLSFWMGQHWEVDWVSNIYDKKHLYFRNGKVVSV